MYFDLGFSPRQYTLDTFSEGAFRKSISKTVNPVGLVFDGLLLSAPHLPCSFHPLFFPSLVSQLLAITLMMRYCGFYNSFSNNAYDALLQFL